MSKKKRNKSKKQPERIPHVEITQPQYSNPVIGMARLFEFLGNCSQFPVSIKAASTISGVPEDEVTRVLKSSLYYFVWRDEISTISMTRRSCNV